MLDRLNPAALVRGQWKSLSDYRNPRVAHGDVVARAIVYIGPLAVGLLVWLIDGRISAPGPLLAGVALLTGGLLSTFTHLSTLRLKLTERAEQWQDAERLDRDAMDESATHLLVAAYASAITAALLVVGMNVTEPNQPLVGIFAIATSVAATFVLINFLMVIPRLYGAYVSINSVRSELSGQHSGDY